MVYAFHGGHIVAGGYEFGLIEECFQQAKNEAGSLPGPLLACLVRPHHLSMLALARLAVSRPQAAKGEPSPVTRA